MCQSVTDLDDFYMSDCWLDFVPTNNSSQKDPAPEKPKIKEIPKKHWKSNFRFEEVEKVEYTNETINVDIKSETDDADVEDSTDVPLYVSQRLRSRKKEKSSNISYATSFGKFKKDKLKIKSAKKKPCFESDEGRSNPKNIDASLLCKSQEDVDVFKPVAVVYESEEEFQGGFTDDSSSEISPNKDDATNIEEVPLNESECNVSNTNSLNTGTVLIKESPKIMIKLEENDLLSEIDSTPSKSRDKLSKSKVAENESPSDDGATPSAESLEGLSKGRVACAVCDKSYKYSSDLTKHMKKIHAGCDLDEFLKSQTADLSCKICNKQFNCRKNLNGHMSVHTLEKKLVHECELCNKRFSKAELLLNHVYEHTGVKSHTCETCGKQYTRMANLRIHVRVAHMQVSEHTCAICDRKFSRIEHLKNHMAMHTGLKKHECGTCGKKYTQVGNLQRHERVHTGNRPFLCQYCGVSFTQKTILVDHLAAVHTGGDIKQCHVCSKYFSHISRLRKHLREEHGQPAVGDNGQPAVGDNGQHVDDNGQCMVGDNRQRVVDNNGQHMVDNNGQRVVGDNGQRVVGDNGQHVVGDNGQHVVDDGQQVVLDNKQRLEENGQHLDKQTPHE